AYRALNQRSLEQGPGPGIIVRTTDQIVDALATRLPVAKETIRTRVLAGMEVGAGYLFRWTQGAIQSMTSVLVTNVLAIIFLYYLLRYGEGWVHRAVALVPLSPD